MADQVTYESMDIHDANTDNSSSQTSDNSDARNTPMERPSSAPREIGGAIDKSQAETTTTSASVSLNDPCGVGGFHRKLQSLYRAMLENNKNEAALIAHVQKLRSQIGVLVEKQATDAIVLEKQTEIIARLNEENHGLLRAHATEEQRSESARNIITQLRTQFKDLDTEQSRLHHYLYPVGRTERDGNQTTAVFRKISVKKSTAIGSTKINNNQANSRVVYNVNNQLADNWDEDDDDDTVDSKNSKEIDFTEWKLRNKGIRVQSSFVEQREPETKSNIRRATIVNPLIASSIGQQRFSGWDDTMFHPPPPKLNSNSNVENEIVRIGNTIQRSKNQQSTLRASPTATTGLLRVGVNPSNNQSLLLSSTSTTSAKGQAHTNKGNRVVYGKSGVRGEGVVAFLSGKEVGSRRAFSSSTRARPVSAIQPRTSQRLFSSTTSSVTRPQSAIDR